MPCKMIKVSILDVAMIFRHPESYNNLCYYRGVEEIDVKLNSKRVVNCSRNVRDREVHGSNLGVVNYF